MSDKLKSSNASTNGVTDNALGECSRSDLKDGYCTLPTVPETYHSPFDAPEGGFAGRPRGFAR
jgi:hypothetical protein